MRRRELLAWFLAAACEARGPLAPPARGPASVTWMRRAIDPGTDIVITADLRALFAHESFGPAARRVTRALADRAVPGSVLADVLEGARAAEIALLPDRTVLMVLADAPAIDPESLTGLDASAQWRRVDRAPEGTLEYAFVPEVGSLFVLADRTWVLGSSTSAQRARAALLAPSDGHPTSAIAPGTSVVVPGARVEQLTRKLVRLARIFDGASELRAALAGEELVVELDYASEGDALRAARTLSVLLAELAKNGGDPLAFFAAGRASSQGDRTIVLRAPISEAMKDSLSRSDSTLLW